MELKTKLDWQGYKLGLQNEETMGCSPEQTAMCTAISEFRENAHMTQEALREVVRMLGPKYGHFACIVRAKELLADFSPDA